MFKDASLDCKTPKGKKKAEGVNMKVKIAVITSGEGAIWGDAADLSLWGVFCSSLVQWLQGYLFCNNGSAVHLYLGAVCLHYIS